MKEQLKHLSVYQPGLSPRALKEHYGIEGELHKLASNENVYGPSPKVKEAIMQHVDKVKYYPESGSPTLRKVISEALDINPARLFFGAGLDEVILMISRAVLTQGDKVVTSEMTFGQYAHNAIVESADIVQVPLQDGHFDLEGMLAAIDDDTALVWVCNPNNPTGTYLPEETLASFIARVPSHIPILVDEAYAEFVTATDYPDTLKLQSQYDNVFILRTFSKAYGLAGMRIGYIIATEEMTKQWNVIRPPFNVNTLAEHAAVAAFQDQSYLASIAQTNAKEREKFFDIPESKHFYPSQTNFVFVKTARPQVLYEALLQVGCITRPFPNGVRITIGFPEQNARMIDVLRHFDWS